jgi:hypothetical protein
MKTKLTTLFFIIFCVNLSTHSSAQSDADNYWILENFNNFKILEDWVIPETDYETYPNNIPLTTVHANVEKGYDCAYGQNALRIRGLEENGSASFTVPNAGRVTFYITGKQKAGDRSVRIYRNNVLIKEEDGFDKYNCIEFSEKIDSKTPLTYKITGGDPTKKDPTVLYYIEVQKYGIDIEPKPEPEPNYAAYWIYEDFKKFEIDEDYLEKTTYSSTPNGIILAVDSANIELGEGCSGGGGKKILRIRGKYFKGGSLEFTVPDAKTVSINVTGKSTYLDRIIHIYKDDVLIKTFENMDRTTCEEYFEEANSNKPIKYRIDGENNTEKPVAVKSIYVEKYETSSIKNISQPVTFYFDPAIATIYFSNYVLRANLYDLNGRLISTSANINQMNVNNLKQGIYIVKTITEEGVFSHKLIKNKNN